MFALQPLPELMTQRLAWVLVHFIWQGTLIAFLLAAVTGLARFRRPTSRYAASMLALLAMIVCPVVTFFCINLAPALPAAVEESRMDESPMLKSPGVEHSIPQEHDAGETPAPTTTDVASAPGFQPVVVPVSQSGAVTTPTAAPTQPISVDVSLWHRTQPWIVAGWFVGVGLLSLRLLLGWIGVWRLRRRVHAAPEWIVDRMQRMAGLLHAGLPLVRLSQHVTEAIAVGFLRPMILLPMAWITELSPDMLDAVIAHELAHIRRGDLWVNLLQRLVETLLFYHPAVWWLSRRQRIERELCCDELVIKVTQNRLRYAETLEHIGRLSLVGSKSVLTVSIMGNRSVLLDRIRHILNLEPRERSSNIWLAGVLPLLVAGLIWWSSVALQGSTVNANEQTASTSKDTPTTEPDKQDTTKTTASDNSPAPTNESAAERPLIVKGRVVDDVTGLPIDRVAWVGGMVDPKQSNHVAWGHSYQAYAELDGGYFEKSLNWHMGDRERVLVGGYEPQSILDALPAVIPANRTIEVTVRLKRGRTIRGFVQDHNGAPATGAKVFYIPEGHRSNITEGVPGANDYDFRDPALSHRDLAVMEATTDNEGKFTMPTEAPGHTGRLAVSTLEIDLCPFPVPADGQRVELKLPAPATLEIDWSFWYLDAMEKAKVNPWDTDDPRYCVLHLVRRGGDREDWKGVSYQRTMLVLGPPQSTVKLSRGATQDVKNDESLPALPDGRVNRSLKGTTKIVGLPAGHYEISRKRGYQMLATESVEIVTGQVTKLEREVPQGATVFGSVTLPENSLFQRQEDEPGQALTFKLIHYPLLTISNAKQGQERQRLDATTVGPDGKFEFRTHLPPGDYLAHLSAYLPESDTQRQFSIPLLTPDLSGEVPFTIPQGDSTPVEIKVSAESHTSRIKPAPVDDDLPGAVTETQRDDPTTKPATPARKAGQTWAVHGRVVGADGKPMSGVIVTASSGQGSLKQTGNAETDQDGRYEFQFGPGILYANDPVQLQAALITAHKAGFFEKTLSRQGDLLAARILPLGKLNRGEKTIYDIILPDASRGVNFVMLPAAKVSGTLIDENEKPLAGYDVSVTGEQMPPGSSVITSVKSDDKGQFKLTDIPTGFKYQFLIRHPERDLPRAAWASGPLEFKAGSSDEIFLQEPEREVEANRFELQVKGPGVGWKTALRIGHLHHKLEPHGDFLTGIARLHAATLRLELNPPPEPTADTTQPPANGNTPKPAAGNPERPASGNNEPAAEAKGPMPKPDSPALPQLAKLEGIILDADKKPLTGARVWLVVERDGTGYNIEPRVIQEAKTGSNGEFQFLAPKPEIQLSTVWVVGAEHQLGWRSSTGDVVDRAADKFVVQCSGEATVIRIVDPANKPVEGASVALLSINRPRFPVQVPRELNAALFTNTDAQGIVRSTGIPADAIVSAEVQAPGWGRQALPSGYVDPWATSSKELTIALRPVGRVEGQLKARSADGNDAKLSIAGVKFQLVSGAAEYSRRAVGRAEVTTDADGRFVVPHMAEGSLQLAGRPAVDQTPRVVIERVSIEKGLTVQLPAQLMSPTRVHGIVRTEDTKKPASDFSLDIDHQGLGSSTEEWRLTTKTNAEGIFEVYLPPGKITLYQRSHVANYADISRYSDSRPKYLISAGLAQLEIPTWELSPAISQKGRLVDRDGKPLVGWDLNGFPTTKRNSINCCNAHTGEDGAFTIDYPKRFPPVLFKVRHEDFQTDLDLDDAKPMVEIVEQDPLVLKVTAKISPAAPRYTAPAVPAKADPKRAAIKKPADVVEAQLPAFDLASKQQIFDIRRMELVFVPFFSASRQTGLQFDRLLQDLSLGDITWVAKTRQLVGLSNARLVLLEVQDWPETASMTSAELLKSLAQRGTTAITLPQTGAAFAAIQTGAGHVAIVRAEPAARGMLNVESRRLTKAEEIPDEQANDGIDQVAWGPVVDGWQAGSVYRNAAANRPQQNHSLGDLVQLKVFVRNAGSQARDYSWQREKPYTPLPARLPRLEHWVPVVLDAQGRRAITSTEPYHSQEVLQTVTLQPSEAVLVGTASFVLWSSVDVGFGVSPNQQAAVVVSPGKHRLVIESETGLADGPLLRTGELVLDIQTPDKSRVESLTVLDMIEHQARDNDDDWIGWVAAKRTRRTRSALALTSVELQTIPCRAFDADTKQPVAGAVATIEFFVWGPDQSNDHLCKYAVLTDAEGRFDMQIPRPLLGGYRPDWKPDFRVHITHPRYTETFARKSLPDLLQIGLVAKDGSIREPGPVPTPGVPLDQTKFASFQAVALKPARTVSGRLLGNEKRPLPNVHIYGSNAQGWPILSGTPHTDAQGRFRFNIPAKQTIKLEFRSGSGRSYVTTKPEQTDLGDILAVPGVKVRGQVLDRSGKPVARVSVTTPAWPDANSQPNFIQRTDANGWFETDLLAPGEYQTEVGDIVPPGNDNEPRLSGLPPDLYVPVRFTVQAGKPVADLKLSPAEFSQVTSTLITTVPKPAEGKLPYAIDPLFWRVVNEKARREREKLQSGKKPDDNGSPLKIETDSDDGTPKIVLGDTPDEQQDIMKNWVRGFSRSPMLTVSGTLNGGPWKRTPKFQEFTPETDPPTHSFKLPRELTDVALEPGDYVQHLQLGTGPKLFGKGLKISQSNVDQLDLKIYRYRPTTLKLVCIDAAGQPVPFKDDKLPSDLTVKAQYVREAEVRQAGGIFESSESLMSRWVLDNSVVHFVLPGEEIEVTVTHAGKPAPYRITLKEGETRTVTVSLTSDLKWTEKSEPTPVE